MSQVCEDVNECNGDPCTENADCTNFDGGYNCTCREGYDGEFVVGSCRDRGKNKL